MHRLFEICYDKIVDTDRLVVEKRECNVQMVIYKILQELKPVLTIPSSDMLCLL